MPMWDSSMCSSILVEMYPCELWKTGSDGATDAPRIDEELPTGVVHNNGDMQVRPAGERLEEPLPVVAALRRLGNDVPDVGQASLHPRGRAKLSDDLLRLRLIPPVHAVEASCAREARPPSPFLSVCRTYHNSIWNPSMPKIFDSLRTGANDVKLDQGKGALEVWDCEGNTK